MFEFKTILEETAGTIIEKKSKFIATILPVNSKEDAEQKLKELKKKYADARHNCYAYCLLNNENEITKSSDDGEPSGTAGIPILKAIKEKGLCNILVVVTRYFGGILLGTGGLQRAYTNATLEAINNAKILVKQIGYEIELDVNYSNLEYIKYYLEQCGGEIAQTIFLNDVKIKIEVNEKAKDEILNKNSKVR